MDELISLPVSEGSNQAKFYYAGFRYRKIAASFNNWNTYLPGLEAPAADVMATNVA